MDVQGASGSVDHAAAIWSDALTLLTTVVLPFGADRWYTVAVIVLTPIVAIIVAHRLPADNATRLELADG